MKARAYLRVARDDRGRAKIVATVKPSDVPLTDSRDRPLPTVYFGVDFEIPDAMFDRASDVIATVTVSEDQAHIAADVVERA